MNKPKNQRKNATYFDRNWLSYIMVNDIWPLVFSYIRLKHYLKMRLVCRLFCGLNSDQTLYDKFYKDAAYKDFTQRVFDLSYSGKDVALGDFPYLYPMFMACDFLHIKDLNHLNDVLADKPLHKQITTLPLECKMSRKVMKNGLPSLTKLNSMTLYSGTEFSYKTVQLLKDLTSLQTLCTFVDIVLEHLPQSVTKLELYMNPPLKHVHDLHAGSFSHVTELVVDGVEPSSLFPYFGSVRSLRLNRDSAMNIRDSIGQLSNLRKLELSLSGDALHQFPDFRQLTTLIHLSIHIVRYYGRTKESPETIGLTEHLHLDSLRVLESLEMEMNLDEVPMKNISMKGLPPSLCSLKLKNRHYPISLEEKLTSKFERVTVLFLPKSNISDDELRFVPNVEKLYLDECENINGSGFCYINLQKQLKLITLQKTKINDDCLKFLVGVQYADLAHTNLYGSGAFHLAGVKIIDLSYTFINCSLAPFSGADIINVANTEITDQCLKGLKHVRHLVLDYCHITEAGFAYLDECSGMRILSASLDKEFQLTDNCIQNFPDLRKLRSYGCALTDVGLSYIPKIRMMIIQGDRCTVTLDGLMNLRKFHAYCRVNWLKDCSNRASEFQEWVKAKKITQMGNLGDGYWDYYEMFWDIHVETDYLTEM